MRRCHGCLKPIASGYWCSGTCFREEDGPHDDDRGEYDSLDDDDRNYDHEEAA